MNQQNAKATGSYVDTDVVYLDFSAAPSASISIMTTGNVTVSVTNSSDVGSGSIWVQCELTNNGCAVTGPVAGVKLEATGGGDYCVRVG